RRATRTPRRKRFYARADLLEIDGGFTVTLDGKPIRTPSGRQVVAPVKEIAEAVAAEWEAQRDTIDPLTMPMTRFANSVVRSLVDCGPACRDDADGIGAAGAGACTWRARSGFCMGGRPRR